MWQQTHYPHAAGIALTALAAATPIFVLLVLLGVARRPAWLASLIGLAVALIMA